MSGSTSGMNASAGPIGCEPPISTAMVRASSFVAIQSRKNAAQSGFSAVAEMP